jgi:hypothetical protein
MPINFTYTIECLPEEIPFRGNAMASGDPDIDRETEDYIARELERGNDWARCTVKVTCQVEGHEDIAVGVDYLGCCSYRSEEDFRTPGGYFDNMCREAREDLIRSLKASLDRGATAARILRQIGKA